MILGVEASPREGYHLLKLLSTRASPGRVDRGPFDPSGRVNLLSLSADIRDRHPDNQLL